jgi:hypothetical protein
MRRMLLPCLAVLMLGVHRPLAAQQNPPISLSKRGAPVKSPTTARLIGIIPGAGHVYAGETKRGFGYLGGLIALAVVGGTMVAVDCGANYDAGSDKCESSAGENLLVAAVIGVWGWSIYDAGLAAQRTNAKQLLRTSLILAPQRSRGVAGGGRGVKLGVSIATR